MVSKWESAAGVHLLVMKQLSMSWKTKEYSDPDSDISMGLDVQDAAWIKRTKELVNGVFGQPTDRVRDYASIVARALLGDKACSDKLNNDRLPDWLPHGIAIYDGIGAHVSQEQSHRALTNLSRIQPLAEHILHVRFEYFAPPVILPSLRFETLEPGQFEFLRTMPRLCRIDFFGIPRLNVNAITYCLPAIRANKLRCITFQDCSISRGVRFDAHAALGGIRQIGLCGVSEMTPDFVVSLAELPALNNLCITACAQFNDACMEVFFTDKRWRTRKDLTLAVGECDAVTDTWLHNIPRIRGHSIILLDFNLMKNMLGKAGAFSRLQVLDSLKGLKISGADGVNPRDLLAVATCFASLSLFTVAGEFSDPSDVETVQAMLCSWSLSTVVHIEDENTAHQAFETSSTTSGAGVQSDEEKLP